MKKLFNHPIAIGLSVFIVVLLLGTILNISGFHFQGINIVRGGNIEILAPKNNSLIVSVFLDQKKISSGKSLNENLLIENVPPGPHSILVFNDTKWPWKKDIVVTSNDTASLSPFLVNKNPSGTIVTNLDTEYTSLVESINSSPLPTLENKLTSHNGLVSLWIESGSLLASWNGNEGEIPGYFCNDEGRCKNQVVVLETADQIRGADFYKSREDVVIVAFSNGVFALEIDKRGVTQNFQPIYKGTELPRFKNAENDTVHVVDGSAVFIINL